MATVNLDKAKAVMIQWTDACSHNGWQDAPDDGGQLTCPVASVGWLIRQNKTEVTLAQSITAGGSCGDLLTVPRAWIQRITRL